MPDDPATYRRLRAAVIAADDSSEVTRLTANTELSLPRAIEYASDYMRLERRKAVRFSITSGLVEIAPERRAKVDRRICTERRLMAAGANLWLERRSGHDRRLGVERRTA